MYWPVAPRASQLFKRGVRELLGVLSRHASPVNSMNLIRKTLAGRTSVTVCQPFKRKAWHLLVEMRDSCRLLWREAFFILVGAAGADSFVMRRIYTPTSYAIHGCGWMHIVKACVSGVLWKSCGHVRIM